MNARKPSTAGATTIGATEPDRGGAATEPRVAGLVLAWKPRDLVADDRAPLDRDLVVGRGSECGWCLPDSKLSRSHFSVTVRPAGAGLALRDLGSRNGVFVGGARVEELADIGPGDVIRAGRCLFVVVADLAALARPSDPGDQAMAGRFHTAAILYGLRVAARTGRHILLEGESGAGKELAAGHLHRLFAEVGERRKGSLVAHNAACFAGEDDAVGTLFGVRKGAFTGVVDRTGALELAEGGTLFLDEVHNLPPRVQRSLLRFAEDGLFAPLGSGAAARRADVRMILGTNASVEEACDDGRLARDLMARLHRVAIPPLRERRADVPHIFQRVLHRALPAETAELISSHLDAPVVERLCLHDYRWGNVRELEELAAVVGARLAEGEEPARALREAVDALLAPAGAESRDADWAPPPRSAYEQRRAEIVAAFREAGGNLKQLESTLRARGFECNRRWLTIFLDRWGVREIRKRG